MKSQIRHSLLLLLALWGINCSVNTVMAAPVTYDVTWGHIFFGDLPVGTLTVDDTDPGFGVGGVPLLNWSLENASGLWNKDDTVLFGTTPTLYFNSVSHQPTGFALYSLDDVFPQGNKALIFQFSYLDGLFFIFDKHGHKIAAGNDPDFTLAPSAPSPVPLPAALPILLTGLGGLAFLRWRRTHWLARQI